MSLAAEARLPVLRRLWLYQAERFPLARTAVMLATFVAASINLSAFLAARPLAAWPAYVVGFIVTVILFFQLRAADELKDGEADRLYRPERPIPRGLVSLSLILGIAFGGVPVAAAVAALFDVRLLWLLALIWAWMGLMTAEFFAPEWLRARPFLYLASHMILMPLIALFATALEWLPAGSPAAQLWLFVALAFVNGCVLEIGRKVYAPQNERKGVETYSALLGAQSAALLWAGCVAVAFMLLVALAVALDALAPIALVGAATLAVAIAVTAIFVRSPQPRAQRLVETAAAVWVLACYAAVAFMPLL